MNFNLGKQVGTFYDHLFTEINWMIMCLGSAQSRTDQRI